MYYQTFTKGTWYCINNWFQRTKMEVKDKLRWSLTAGYYRRLSWVPLHKNLTSRKVYPNLTMECLVVKGTALCWSKRRWKEQRFRNLYCVSPAMLLREINFKLNSIQFELDLDLNSKESVIIYLYWWQSLKVLKMSSRKKSDGFKECS